MRSVLPHGSIRTPRPNQTANRSCPTLPTSARCTADTISVSSLVTSLPASIALVLARTASADCRGSVFALRPRIAAGCRRGSTWVEVSEPATAALACHHLLRGPMIPSAASMTRVLTEARERNLHRSFTGSLKRQFFIAHFAIRNSGKFFLQLSRQRGQGVMTIGDLVLCAPQTIARQSLGVFCQGPHPHRAAIEFEKSQPPIDPNRRLVGRIDG